MEKKRILNLYSGIGGNRWLWGDKYDVTAVEQDEERASFYQKRFAGDKVILADAHEFLRKFYADYDIIWSSPPCPTHSKLMLPSLGLGREFRYPDMTLYQEIKALKHIFKGVWVVENVVSYYEPLEPAQRVARHLFWANFKIRPVAGIPHSKIGGKKFQGVEDLERMLGISVADWDVTRKKKVQSLRNCVHPRLGKHVLDCALASLHHKTNKPIMLFDAVS